MPETVAKIDCGSLAEYIRDLLMTTKKDKVENRLGETAKTTYFARTRHYQRGHATFEIDLDNGETFVVTVAKKRTP